MNKLTAPVQHFLATSSSEVSRKKNSCKHQRVSEMEHTIVNGNSEDPSLIIIDTGASESEQSKRVSNNLLNRQHLKFLTEGCTERTESRFGPEEFSIAGGSEHVALIKQNKQNECNSLYVDNYHPSTEGNDYEEVKLSIFGASIGLEAS